MALGTFVNTVICFLYPVFPLWYVQALLGLPGSLGAIADPGMQLVVTYISGGAYGSAMGLLRSAGAAARIFSPFAAGALYDVEFGAFMGRRHLLSFWGKGWFLCQCMSFIF